MGIESKKVCFVATYTYGLFDETKTGLPITGLDVQLYNWSTELAQDISYSVHFVVGDFGQNKVERIQNVTLWKSFVPGESGLIRGLGHLFRLYRLFKEIDADVYVDRGASEPMSFELGLFCRLFRKKFVHMVASDADVDGTYRKKHPLLGVAHEISLRLANRVTHQNRLQEKFLGEKGISSSEIPNSFRMVDTSITEKEYVLWVGSSYSLKRPEIFLDLAREFPHEKFVLILQKHDDAVFNKIQQLSKEISNLTFIPGVSFSGVSEYFRKAKLLVNTSEYEGFPNTFVQAMMYSLPILSLNVDPNGILERERCGFMCCNDQHVLRERFEEILSDAALLTSLSKTARDFATRNLDVQKNITIFKEIIR